MFAAQLASTLQVQVHVLVVSHGLKVWVGPVLRFWPS